MQFTAPWWPVVVRGLIGLVLIAAVLGVFVFGIATARGMARAQDGKLFRACYVELINTGNAQTRFELRADDPLNGLSFEFGLNGAALSHRQVLEPIPGTAPAAAGSQRTAGPISGMPAASRPGGGVSSAKQALGFGSMVGGVMSSIGYLLPGSLGANLLSMGSRLQTGQAAVSRLERQGELAKSVAGQTNGQKPAAAAAGTAPVQTAIVSAPGRSIAHVWYQTPPVDPADTLAVTLTMRPLKTKQTEQYFFRVISQAVDVPDLPQLIEQGKVEIKGLSLGQRLLPWIVIAGTLFVMFILMVLLAVTAGLFG
jgi:hypothetical protein